MPPGNIDDFYRTAFGSDFLPYDYQRRLACGERDRRPEGIWLTSNTKCESKLINIPTGLGKTAAVILAWLWNRLARPCSDHPWPRRLIYCLPMRTLVEQTEKNARDWIEKLIKGHCIPHGPRVDVLMGGEEKTDWDIYPEKDAILIGTQDMLLSRALNRGYGMNRYRWPIHFGLLNNDCLWVMDETQLMGPGLATACQLEAFRTLSAFGSFGGSVSVTWYMSATNNPEQLRTREWRGVQRITGFEFGLSREEKETVSGPVHQRLHAVKAIKLDSTSNFGGREKQVDEKLAKTMVAQHREMVEALNGAPLSVPRRTVVICNTVDRAFKIHEMIANVLGNNAVADLLLMHSRFRPPERCAQVTRLAPEHIASLPEGQIVVATQVIEAGVDLSSGILWSEVAPLASLIQRLGRLNRAGEFNESPWKPLAIIVGVGTELESTGKNEKARQDIREKNARLCLPYDLHACDSAWDGLGKLNGDASPANLEQIQTHIAKSIPRCSYSLQRHELIDFFDTDANLSLGFTDVSPFVRGVDEDTDLEVLWRESWLQSNGEEGVGEPGFSPDFQRDELCPVPISKAKAAREVLQHGWVWRGKDTGWLSMRDVRAAPGMTILLPLNTGGYDESVGWTGEKADNKHGSHYKLKAFPADEEQLSSFANGWQSIAIHTAAVANELRALLHHLLSSAEYEPERNALLAAVPWHDIGKNHFRWRRAALRALLRAGFSKEFIRPHLPVAKFSLSDSPSLRKDNSLVFTGKELAMELKTLKRSFRPGIAHEVASALAFRVHEQTRLGLDRDINLVSLLSEYVIMSHHGRVRKVLRDEIPKIPRVKGDTDVVRGVSEKDTIPAVVIDGIPLGCDNLSIDCRCMGRGGDGHESFTRGVLRLLEHYGPFRLAFFEAVFRAADIRASVNASKNTDT